MIFLGFLLFAIITVLSIIIGGLDKLPPFLDIPSLTLVSLGIAGYTLFFGRKEFVRGMKVFFAFSFPQDDDSMKAGRFFLRLAELTLGWGLLVMIYGFVLMMIDLDPDKMGPPIAVSILGFLYATILSLFVFLPIGLRLSPPTLPMSGLWRFSLRQWLIAFAGFFLIRCLFVAILIVLQEPGRTGLITAQEFGSVVSYAAFAFNPGDPLGKYPLGFDLIPIFWDLPGLVIVVGGCGAFWLASGQYRKWLFAPVVILIGIQGTITGCVMMLCDFKPEYFGAGVLVSMLTTLYGFIAAAGFLIADVISPGTAMRSVPGSLDGSEDIEQAKQIIDNVVERERR